MSKIFINYRRSTDHASAGRMYDHLQSAFGKDDVFFDVDGIEPGIDFIQVLTDRVAECGIFLAVIGKGWIEVIDDEGARRILDHNDWVRVEIASALAQNKRVIPVLIDGASMPKSDRLPEAIAGLARRQAIRLTHEQFTGDVQRLIGKIAEIRAAEARRLQEEARVKAAEEQRLREEARAAAAAQHQREEAHRAAEARQRREELRKAAEQRPDPLAELARIVNQDDPFRALLKSHGGAQNPDAATRRRPAETRDTANIEMWQTRVRTVAPQNPVAPPVSQSQNPSKNTSKEKGKKTDDDLKNLIGGSIIITLLVSIFTSAIVRFVFGAEYVYHVFFGSMALMVIIFMAVIIGEIRSK